MTKNPPKKEEVIVALLRTTKQLAKHLMKQVIGFPCREKRIGSCGS